MIPHFVGNGRLMGVDGRLNGLVIAAITTIKRLVESLDGKGVNHWDIVLDQLSIDLGMDL